MRKIAIGISVLGILVATSFGSLVHSANVGAPAFSDVPAGSTYSVSLSFLKEKGMIKGYEDGSFKPDQLLKRAEALAMIRAATATKGDTSKIEAMVTANTTAADDKPFQDINKRQWFYDLVRESKAAGIVSGAGDGTHFKPHVTITLAEGLRMLFKSSDVQLGAPEQAKLPAGLTGGEWYAPDFTEAVSRGIILQQADGNIRSPGSELTRGDLALILYKFVKNKEGVVFGYASWYGDGLAKTKIPKNHEYREKSLTAAHLTHPFGTLLRVTNVANGKMVDVVVNDRGPYVTGRIIDLSKSGFSALESPGMGVISVQVEVVN